MTALFFILSLAAVLCFAGSAYLGRPRSTSASEAHVLLAVGLLLFVVISTIQFGRQL